MFYCGALHSSSLARRDQLMGTESPLPGEQTERSSRRRSALTPRASPEREPAAEQVRVSVRGTVICSGVNIFRYLGIISGKHAMVTTVTLP